MNLYAVALVALRLDPFLTVWVDERTGETQAFYDGDCDAMSAVNIIPEIALTADAVLARSEDEAKEIALGKLRERCPQNEGWICHTATTCFYDLGELVKALRRKIFDSLPDEACAESARTSDVEEWSEWIL